MPDDKAIRAQVRAEFHQVEANHEQAIEADTLRRWPRVDDDGFAVDMAALSV